MASPRDVSVYHPSSLIRNAQAATRDALHKKCAWPTDGQQPVLLSARLNEKAFADATGARRTDDIERIRPHPPTELTMRGISRLTTFACLLNDVWFEDQEDSQRSVTMCGCPPE